MANLKKSQLKVRTENGKFSWRDTESENTTIEEPYGICSQYGRWRVKKDTDAFLDIWTNDEQLNLTIDRAKLGRKESSAIKLKLKKKLREEYGYFANFINDLERKLDDTWEEEKVSSGV